MNVLNFFTIFKNIIKFSVMNLKNIFDKAL